MRTLQRAAAALTYPAILCLGVACERTDTPTEARSGRMATDAISTDLSQSYQVILSCTDRHSVVLSGDAATLTSLAADLDAINGSGTGTTFMTQHGGGDCVGNVPAAVRFYFVSPSASGSTVGTPPAGFYTQFWWSNPVHMQLITGGQSGMITATVGDPSEWSDWNGQPASSPEVFAAFEKAIHNVQTVGLSFGGLCFFETGVTAVYPSTPPPDEVFSSNFSETPTP